jgi:hypothetical protein
MLRVDVMHDEPYLESVNNSVFSFVLYIISFRLLWAKMKFLRQICVGNQNRESHQNPL